MSNLILCGFKGVGKSYYGKKLAKELKLDFIDTDRHMEMMYGNVLSNKEMYREFGEAEFRIKEKQTLDLISNIENHVIALGGGVTSHSIPGITVYLFASKEWLKKRLFSKALPLIFDEKEPEKSFEMLYEKRRPYYEKMASNHVRVENRRNHEILTELRGIFGK